MAVLGVILVLIGATLMVAEALLRAITGPRGGDAARADASSRPGLELLALVAS